jgi:hypothetical protein
MSQSKSPTVGYVFPIYNYLLDKIDQFMKNSQALDYEELIPAIETCENVLKTYYAKTDDNNLYAIAASNSF